MKKTGVIMLIAAGMAVTGCDTIQEFLHRPDPPLKGRRLAVLPTTDLLKADARISDVKVTLPRPAINGEWPQINGYPNHAMHHLALGKSPLRSWSVTIGTGSQRRGWLSFSRSRRLLARPIIGGSSVFSMDAEGIVRAFDLKDGRRLWSVSVLPRHEKDGDIGGAIAYENSRVIAATGAAEIVVLDAIDGKVIWRKQTDAPVRSGPAVSRGRIFIVTAENTVLAYDVRDGTKLWSYAGVAAKTGILGGGSPAVDEGMLVASRSSGEIVALRVENGQSVWTESVTADRRRNQISGLTAIAASPVIDRGVVYAGSDTGRLVATELFSGRRLWDVEIGGLHTPWVAGDYVFVLTNRATLAALQRSDGKVRWAIRLDRFTDDKDLEFGRPFWTGPVLAGDRLLVAGSHGEALSVSPYTGEVIGWIPLTEGVFIQPVVAQRTVLFLDDSGRLTAMR
ncbi:MAG: PQQ-binding-like beta-propeller repeat protein [Rhodospirillaceae bacterium]|nr:PQQ-binding-like beta-propeller repeat protein [Rhodospirillaceae bacterium]